MPVLKKLVKMGTRSWGFIVTKDMQRVLGVDGDAEKVLVVEVVGDALLLRRAGAPAPDASEIERAVGRAAAVSVPGPVWRPALQRLLAAMHRLGPSTAVAIARELGLSREHTSASLKAAAADGWVEKTIAGWELTTAAARWFSYTVD